MIYMKFFEDFGNIDEKQILDCISKNGYLFIDIVNGYEGDTSGPWKPVSVQNDIVTVERDGTFYDVKLKNIKKLDYGV